MDGYSEWFDAFSGFIVDQPETSKEEGFMSGKQRHNKRVVRRPLAEEKHWRAGKFQFLEAASFQEIIKISIDKRLFIAMIDLRTKLRSE